MVGESASGSAIKHGDLGPPDPLKAAPWKLALWSNDTRTQRASRYAHVALGQHAANGCTRMELRVGSRYRLGRKIGSGSFGDIYLGNYDFLGCSPFFPPPRRHHHSHLFAIVLYTNAFCFLFFLFFLFFFLNFNLLLFSVFFSPHFFIFFSSSCYQLCFV